MINFPEITRALRHDALALQMGSFTDKTMQARLGEALATIADELDEHARQFTRCLSCARLWPKGTLYMVDDGEDRRYPVCALCYHDYRSDQDRIDAEQAHADGLA